MNAFEYTKNEIIASAPSPKAADFAKRIAAQIEAKGEKWINDHKHQLNLVDAESDTGSVIARVKDQRTYFLAQWQLTLANG